jgi:hypothetical protein
MSERKQPINNMVHQPKQDLEGLRSVSRVVVVNGERLMTVAQFGARLDVGTGNKRRAAVSSIHRPIRPDWICRGLRQPWPCRARRAELLGEYHGARSAWPSARDGGRAANTTRVR